MARLVSRRPVTTKARVESQIGRRWIAVDKVALGLDFLPPIWSVVIIPPPLHTHSFITDAV